MGRGRAKAKQTKVARQLKYNSGATDLERLRAELIGEGHHDDEDQPADEFAEGDDDLYARYADEDAGVDAEGDDVDDGTFGGNGRRRR